MIIFDGRGAHLINGDQGNGIGEGYVISLKIICCSKRREDLLSFCFGYILSLFVFIANPLSNGSRLWEVA